MIASACRKLLLKLMNDPEATIDRESTSDSMRVELGLEYVLRLQNRIDAPPHTQCSCPTHSVP